MFRLKFLFALLLGAIMISPAVADQKSDIVETAISAKSFTTLVAAVKAAGLVETLKGKEPFTVFAPTDEAFARLPDGILESLLRPENKEKLKAILTYHVVPGQVMAADVVKMDTVPTAFGQDLAIKVSDNKVMVNDARVIETDIDASNGVIHSIDAVILPKDIVETAADASNLSTLVSAIKAAGLVATLKSEGPFTVFAPTNEAFAKLPASTLQDLLRPENKARLEQILTYHVLPGSVVAANVVQLRSAKTVNGKEIKVRVRKGQVTIDDAKVIKTDIKTLNGVIHVIDSVILPQ